MRTHLLLLIVAATAAACGPPTAAPPAPSALEEAARIIPARGMCATLIPNEWSSSWPVPSKRGGALHYRIFFYGREGHPSQGFVFHAPQGEASFTPGGQVLDCRRLPGEPVTIPPDARFESMTLGEIGVLSSRLYAGTEAVAQLYVTGRETGETDRARVAAFARDFAALADPAHAGAYRSLDPDFWAWVEKNGGTAPDQEGCDQRIALATLIANPDAYHGKALWINAYTTIDFENMTVCPSENERQMKSCLWLVIDDGPYKTEKDYQRYESKLKIWKQWDRQTIAIRGTFDKGGRGHLSMWPGEMRTVTEAWGHDGGWNFSANRAVSRSACADATVPSPATPVVRRAN
ncbi:MAG: hypothetical protein ACKVQA_11925 [Burkholderiales bacterium]